jgi:hypothetical protein
VDEFSAVSRRLPIWQLYERARSLGLAVQVSAQSWQGLAAEEDDRYRIAATADGGIWLLRTPHPEPVTALAGQRPALDTSRRLLGVPRWAHEGSSRSREVAVADPALIRGLGVGQAAYIYRGGVTYIQVKRLVAAPAALARAQAPPAGTAAEPAGARAEPAGARAEPAGTLAAGPPLPPRPAAAPHGAGAPPGVSPPPAGRSPDGANVPSGDAGALLDEAFGPEPAPARGRRARPGGTGPPDSAS